MRRLLLAAAVVLGLAASGYGLIPRPELRSHLGYSRAYCDRNDRLLRLTLAPDERYRLPVQLDEVAAELREATLLYEDRDFYRHPGVDPAALLRAFWSTYVRRERIVGASTIAMQVARLRWHLHTRSLAGKLRQILRAVQLTRHYDKDAILEAYLNLAPYGRNIEGIEAASLIYFDKHATELTLPEALSLAVVPQNPNKRNPTSPAGQRQIVAARARLFESWLETHPEDAGKWTLLDLPFNARSPEELPFAAPHFVDDLEAQLPTLRRGEIRTTIDLDLQRHIEAQLRTLVARRGVEGIRDAAVAVLNHSSMELEAVVGSADFGDATIDGQVNGTTAKRSPGSALKPFVYALALDQGLIHPRTLLEDAPRRYGGFSPENFDQKFLGPVFASDALVKSRNVPAVQLQAQLAAPGLYGLLRESGVSDLRGPDYYGLALTLGGAELTMEELLRLYALLPNAGRLRPLHKLLEEREEGSTAQLLSPEACFLILDILAGNPVPTRPELIGQVVDDVEVAWKTGTSFAFRDAWAVGICGPYVVAVWVGNFSGEGNPAFVGRTAAGPLLFEICRSLGRSRSWSATDGPAPSALNLRRIEVCALSGELPGRFCRRTAETWFIPGVSPIRVCSVHRGVPVDRQSGLRACHEEPERSRLQVYEFWPTNLLHIFRSAGIAIKAPPPFAEDCRLDERGLTGMPPVIDSPDFRLKYSLRDGVAAETIPFSASADADVRRLYWFVDERYVGKVPAGQTLFWTPEAGEFSVRVVDDHGRAAGTELHVGRVSAPPRNGE